MPARIESLYSDLDIYLKGVAKAFIDPFLPADPSVRPEAYKYQVTAYCVLAHAAFEEYVESVALRVVSESVNQYVMSRGVRINKSLTALTIFSSVKMDISEDDATSEIRFFDRFRLLLDDIKTSYSNLIHNNHGVSIKYLRKMLEPLAIDIKEDAKLKNSLAQLANARGTYAHKKIPAKIVSPEDAAKYVKDCLELAEDIKNNAKAILL